MGVHDVSVCVGMAWGVDAGVSMGVGVSVGVGMHLMK